MTTIKCGNCRRTFKLRTRNSKRFIYEAGENFDWVSTVCSLCSTVHHLFIDDRQNYELWKNGVECKFQKSPGNAVKSNFSAAIGSNPVVIEYVVVGFLDQLAEESMQQAS